MKITKRSRVRASSRAIKAAKSTADMLEAFEDKLAEFGIESKTCVEASMDALYDEEDDKVFYRDEGGFGTDGEIYSLKEIKDIWNRDHDSDPSMSYYHSFEEWFRDTRDNGFLSKATVDEVEGCNITGSIILDEDEKDRLWRIADRYNTSTPVSGDWATETTHEAQAIADEFGISIEEAVEIMSDYLGFDDDELGNVLI